MKRLCIGLGSLMLIAVDARVMAQSTESQRMRVETLEQSWRAMNRTRSRGVVPSPRATDTTRAGALVVLSEPELTPLVRYAAPQAWQLLLDSFGAGARVLETIDIVYVLQAGEGSQPGHDLILMQSYRTPDTQRGFGSGTISRERAELGRGIAHNVAGQIVGAVGLPSWMWGVAITEPRERRFLANAFIELATAKDSLTRSCAEGNSSGCQRFLELDQPEKMPLSDPPGGSSRLTQVFRHIRGPLLRVTLRTGGVDARRRLEGTADRNLGERLATAAGVPIDSLMTLWRSEVTRRPVSSVPTTRSVLGLALISLIVLGVSTRRPVRR
ncbi:MAG: hypothetical protein WEE89_13430 [Gemmatimonadota bacterium]